MNIDNQTAERVDLMQAESRVNSYQRVYVTATELNSVYYLPLSWVKRLGSADRQLPNPHYRSGGDMRLYYRERVEQLIATNQLEYEQLMVKREQRSIVAKAATKTKVARLAEWANTVGIDVYPLPKNLGKTATFYFKQRSFQYEGVPSPNQCNEQGERGIIAMLRHKYTNYHDLLSLLKGKVGRNEAYRTVRRRVNQAVCTAASIDYGDGSKWNDVEEAWIAREMSEDSQQANE